MGNETMNGVVVYLWKVLLERIWCTRRQAIGFGR